MNGTRLIVKKIMQNVIVDSQSRKISDNHNDIALGQCQKMKLENNITLILTTESPLLDGGFEIVREDEVWSTQY